VIGDEVLLREDASPIRVGDHVVTSPLSAPYPGMEVVEDVGNSTLTDGPAAVEPSTTTPMDEESTAE
jgi:hypothetical protein